MPELPEVETIVRSLARLCGHKIDSIEVVRADVLRPAGVDFGKHLHGRTIAAITRRGKKIIFTLDDGNRFYIHLGMSGRLSLHNQQPARLPHTHLIVTLGNEQLRFVDPRRFGGVWWVGRHDAIDRGLGPEPLTLRPNQLARRLNRTMRAIKNALLDQSLIAGLGNIYVDEALHHAGIHPLTPANLLDLKQIDRLNRAIKSTLRRALRHKGSTLRDYRDADGNAGGFQKLHRVYHRATKPCFTCRTPIQSLVVGGRSTHFCPKCQPLALFIKGE